MGVSSFLGYFSLKTGAVIIGIIQLIGALFLCRYCFGYCNSDYLSFWLPILSIQMMFAVILFIGIEKRDANFVFPFVCLYYVIVMLVIFNVTSQIVENLFNMYKFQHEWSIIVSKIIIFYFMYYFLRVICAFYEQLLQEKFTASLSISLSNSVDMDNNEKKYKEAVKQILAEEGIATSFI